MLGIDARRQHQAGLVAAHDELFPRDLLEPAAQHQGRQGVRTWPAAGGQHELQLAGKALHEPHQHVLDAGGDDAVGIVEHDDATSFATTQCVDEMVLDVVVGDPVQRHTERGCQLACEICPSAIAGSRAEPVGPGLCRPLVQRSQKRSLAEARRCDDLHDARAHGEPGRAQQRTSLDEVGWRGWRCRPHVERKVERGRSWPVVNGHGDSGPALVRTRPIGC
jgi:hypothetical protein